MNKTFMAGVHYGDLKGTSAADKQDVKTIEGWLKKNHQEHRIDSNDFLLVYQCLPTKLVNSQWM